MRIFITSGTGFIGSAVVDELIGAGHEVIGLVRSESSVQRLRNAGVTVINGSLEDIDSLKRGADSADAVIHTAYIHDFSNIGAAVETDKRAIEAIGETLVGSNRPFIVTSGVPVGKNGQVMTEDDVPDPSVFPRLSEAAALPFAARDVRVSIVRPSRLVHGEWDEPSGFITLFIHIARKNGVSAYIGNGDSRCQAVHRLDTAHLYRLAVEKGEAGARYQAVADEGIPFRAIAEAIAAKLNIPAVSISAEKAAEHFGFLAMFAGTDNPASSEKTRKLLGWQPVHPTLLQDLASDFYFK